MDYSKLHRLLFNKITDAIDLIECENYDGARALLIAAHQEVEEAYLSRGDKAQKKDILDAAPSPKNF